MTWRASSIILVLPFRAWFVITNSWSTRFFQAVQASKTCWVFKAGLAFRKSWLTCIFVYVIVVRANFTPFSLSWSIYKTIVISGRTVIVLRSCSCRSRLMSFCSRLISRHPVKSIISNTLITSNRCVFPASKAFIVIWPETGSAEYVTCSTFYRVCLKSVSWDARSLSFEIWCNCGTCFYSWCTWIFISRGALCAIDIAWVSGVHHLIGEIRIRTGGSSVSWVTGNSKETLSTRKSIIICRSSTFLSFCCACYTGHICCDVTIIGTRVTFAFPQGDSCLCINTCDSVWGGGTYTCGSRDITWFTYVCTLVVATGTSCLTRISWWLQEKDTCTG